VTIKDFAPGALNPRIDSYRPQQQTLVEDAERLSLPAGLPSAKNRGLLTVLTGPQRGMVHRLEGDACTVGRSTDADVPIADPALSRIHARIYRVADAFFVEDAGSTNGTFLGDERVVTPLPLEPGSRLRFGRRTIVSFSLHDELEEAAKLSVHRAALHDRLTGVYNRGVFDDRLAAEFAFAKRHGTPLSVLIFDVDHFKRFNDEYGHLTGDAVLVAIGQKVVQTVRVEDVAARYGGEEFGVIARGSTPEKAGILAERLRVAVESIRLPWGEGQLSVTISVGGATLEGPGSLIEPSLLLAAADRALYEAKRAGRNRVAFSARVA
jgi:diguanylate cyclase (GGDEF)-like protein